MLHYIKTLVLFLLGAAIIAAFLALGVVVLLALLVIIPLVRFLHKKQFFSQKMPSHSQPDTDSEVTYIETEYHEVTSEENKQ